MAEPQTDTKQCKFTLNVLLVEKGFFVFDDKNKAEGSVLADALFQVDHVSKIIVAPDHVLVTVDADVDWRVMGREIGAKIRDAIFSGQALVSNEQKQKTAAENTLIEKVSCVLTEQINPAVAAHGGSIELLDVKGRDVFLKMSGGCQGCGMAAVTLRRGVENALREQIPDLGAVYDTTAHEEGKNPYY
jgi:Fe-S cluster biogenesis protein NfuA